MCPGTPGVEYVGTDVCKKSFMSILSAEQPTSSMFATAGTRTPATVVTVAAAAAMMHTTAQAMAAEVLAAVAVLPTALSGAVAAVVGEVAAVAVLPTALSVVVADTSATATSPTTGCPQLAAAVVLVLGMATATAAVHLLPGRQVVVVVVATSVAAPVVAAATRGLDPAALLAKDRMSRGLRADEHSGRSFKGVSETVVTGVFIVSYQRCTTDALQRSLTAVRQCSRQAKGQLVLAAPAAEQVSAGMMSCSPMQSVRQVRNSGMHCQTRSTAYSVLCNRCPYY